MATVTLHNDLTVKLNGELPKLGDMAANFSAVKNDLSEFKLSDLKSKKVLINVFPSVDTGVCAASVRRFNKEASSLENTVVLCLSKDLPFAQSRFCAAEGLENVMTVSAFRCNCFESHYGLLQEDGPLRGLFARAIIVVNEKGEVTYTELVPEITQEPDYEAALAALKK